MGELGDQLFGSDILSTACQLWGDSVLRKPYQDWAAKTIEAELSKPGCGERLFEYFHPIVEESPVPIRTLHDFFWWYNFTQKWQHVKFRFVESVTWDLSAREGSEVIAFYDTVDFQHWSLNNHDLKIRNTWESYKFTAKDFIYRQTKDKAQLKLKKIQSLEKTYFLNKKRIAVDSNYQSIDDTESLKTFIRTDSPHR